MDISGHLSKMRVELGADEVQYFLRVDDQEVFLNQFIGSTITLNYSGEIHCKVCGRKTSKSFDQGFCFPCFKSAPEASECIVKPELCRGHLGEGRNLEWELKNHVQDHFVYLAVSDTVKVGVTRQDQIPTRWIDQGASYATRIAKTPNRYLAGCMEVALKDLFADKTNWRSMLQGKVKEGVDFANERLQISAHLDNELSQYLMDDNITYMHYPVIKYPEKVKSISFDTIPEISGKLNGIKGQYLIFDTGEVLNIRKHTAYLVQFIA